MVITNYNKNQVGLILGGSATTVPTYFIIGSGSGTVTVSQTELIAATDRQLNTAITFPATQKIKWQGDWNSVEISGTALREFGMIISGVALTGSIWSRTGFAAITFDGTNELRIEETWEIF